MVAHTTLLEISCRGSLYHEDSLYFNFDMPHNGREKLCSSYDLLTNIEVTADQNNFLIHFTTTVEKLLTYLLTTMAMVSLQIQAYVNLFVAKTYIMGTRNSLKWFFGAPLHI